jgi:hypothetical protein
VKNNFFFKNPFTNIYEKSSQKSKVSSQILYGEKFKILSKKKNWLKIKTSFDNYIGYIKNTTYVDSFKSTHKIFKLKSKIFKISKNKKFYPTENYLPFASKISILNNKKKFIEYEKNKWIKKNDIKKINYIEKDYLKILKLFLKAKYTWGGKSYNGIDCSALVQLYYFYNNKFFPRDTKDQIKFKKGKKNFYNLKKGNIIYWKGHVAVCVNTKKLIHAYGPKKKVLIMNIKDTIKIIEKSANLKVKKITRI